MDYEKLHRDTINNLQQMVNSGKITAEIARDICADFIPESEDERIRKEIITYLSTVEDKELIPYEPWIAWLKKQGESDIEEPDFFDDFRRTDSEVESKFHEGDWVVRGKTIAQILDVQEQYYIGIDTNGNDFTSSRFLSDDKIHLWTIQDAKEGDVLTWDNGRYIILFKEIKDNIVAYCSYNTHSKHFGISSNYDTQFDCTLNFTPATKEQRDLLSQKMKEAGYEWEADKKELKKIEHKPTESRQETKPNGGIVCEDFNEGDGYYKVNLAYLSKSQVELIENLVTSWQDPTNNTAEWSEDDEQYLLVCKNALRKYQVTDKWDSNIISQWLDNKLKYLRPQSTWKPSEEQMDALRYVTNFDYGGYKAALVSLYEQLKKLKA